MRSPSPAASGACKWCRQRAELGGVGKVLGDRFGDRGDCAGEVRRHLEQGVDDPRRDTDSAVRAFDEVSAGEHVPTGEVEDKSIGDGATRLKQVDRRVGPVWLRGMQAE